jgi:cysteine desulfurase/selenocysteine lyase
MARSLRDPEIRRNEDAVKAFVMEALSAKPLVHLYGRPVAGIGLAGKASVFSFTVDGAHHEDLALILDKMGVAVRSGQMCAEPLMDRFGVTGMVRASFAPFNTMGEAEYFIEALDRAVKMLR